MIQSLYTINDRVAGIQAVIMLPNDTIARRYFKTAFKNGAFKDNATDYVGVRLGTIDTETGEITAEFEELLECYDYLKEVNADGNN